MVIVSSLVSSFAQARQIGLGAVGGLPNMIGADVRYMGSSNFEFGLSMGSLPLDTLLKNKIPLAPISVDLDQPDSYSILPSLGFQMTAFSPYLRLYPWSKSFYLQAAYSLWRFRANIAGDLRNDTTQAISNSVVTGYLDIAQTVVTPQIGWRYFVGEALYFDFGVGCSILRKVTPQSYIGSSLEGVLSLSPEGQAALETAREQVGTQVDSGVATYRARIRFLPSILLTLGISI